MAQHDDRWLAKTLQEECSAHGSNLYTNLQQSVVSLSPSRNILAIAVDKTVLVINLKTQSTHRIELPQSNRIEDPSQEATALCFVGFTSQQAWRSEHDVELLLIGTSTGYFQLHDNAHRLIIRQKVHKSACTNISMKTAHQGLDSDDTSEEILLGFSDAAVRIHSMEILAAFIRHKAQNFDNIAINVTKWAFPKSASGRSACFLLGSGPASLHQRMSDRSHSPKVSILTAGKQPTLGVIEGPEFGGEGILAAVSDLASGLHGLAKTLAYGRPNGYRAGLTGWLSRPKQEHLNKEKEDPVPIGHSSSLISSFEDENRIVTSISLCPRGSLAATSDNLGRVMLVDYASCLVLYMWKAYRNAQLAWLTIQNEVQETEYLLVIFAPNRSAIEVWDPKTQVRKHTWPCTKFGLLLWPISHCGSLQNSSPSFLDLETGILQDLEL